MTTKEQLNIGGYDFKVYRPKKYSMAKEDALRLMHKFGYSSIYTAYDRPSSAKVAIYNDWYDWGVENGIYLRITSRNTFHFSLGGLYTAEDGTEYYLAITACNLTATVLS